MPLFKVTVKWGKEIFSNVDLDTHEPPDVFRAQLFTLTGVEPSRQKIVVKGATLKDSWETVKGIKDDVTVLVMGSVSALPSAPTEKTIFMEDMSEQQLASHLKMPAGLVNLGNTCYMNATVQCLRSIPELTENLQQYQPSSAMDLTEQAASITYGLRGLLSELSASSLAVTPILFLQNMFVNFPRFAEKGEHGGYTQQDANECWTELVRCLGQKLTSGGVSFVDRYLRIDFTQSLRCLETDDEPITTNAEKIYQLSCFIDKDVKYMQTGLQNRLKELVTKHSPALGRDAQYEKTSKISRLPAYLSIQFVRFFFKEKDAVNAKILKDVKFSLVLDVFELCTPDLQRALTPAREEMKAEEERQLEALNQAKLNGEPLKKEKPTVKKPFSFPDDVGSNNSGFYELQAVLTHKGRSSSSGHYVAWVRSKGDDWIMFDDDNVVPVKSEDILKLSGGGDWHSAYVLLYGPKILEVEVAPH